MKKFQFLSCVAISAIALFVGCEAKKPAATSGGATTKSGEHAHEDGTVHKDADEKEHAAHGNGPHDGVVADWGGGKFHVEFTVDHGKKEAMVYILGDDEKTPAPIDATEITLAIKDPAFQASLKASPQNGDPAGKASRFVGNHDNFGIVKEYEGSISGTVSGTPYSGNFKELPH